MPWLVSVSDELCIGDRVQQRSADSCSLMLGNTSLLAGITVIMQSLNPAALTLAADIECGLSCTIVSIHVILFVKPLTSTRPCVNRLSEITTFFACRFQCESGNMRCNTLISVTASLEAPLNICISWNVCNVTNGSQ